MMKKTIAILASAAILAVSLAGCGKETVLDGSETAATLDETITVPLGEFNLMLRYQQAQMEAYGAMFGSTNMYGQDLYGTGEIYGESAKESLLEQFEELYVLEAEASNYGVELTEEEKTAIGEAATSFMEANTDKVKNALGVDQAMTEHLLTLLTVQNKMYDVLTAEVDTEVSDDEAAQKKITYVFVSTAGTETDEDGNTIDLTDEQKAEKKAVLEELLQAASESKDLAAAVDAANEEADEDSQLTANEITYGADSTTPAEEVRAAADKLQDNELAPIVETETGYYAVQMNSTFDEEATQQKKDTIVQERRDALYEEQYTVLAENHVFASVESALAKLTFERVYTTDTSAAGTGE